MEAFHRLVPKSAHLPCSSTPGSLCAPCYGPELLTEPAWCLPGPCAQACFLHPAPCDDGSGKTMFTVLSHLPLEVSCCSLPTKRLKPKK